MSVPTLGNAKEDLGATFRHGPNAAHNSFKQVLKGHHSQNLALCVFHKGDVRSLAHQRLQGKRHKQIVRKTGNGSPN